MKAKIKQKGSTTILELEGNIDFETAKPFRQKCHTILEEKRNQTQLVFNMKGLKFVGSSGLSSFIQTLKELNKSSLKPRFFGVASEFKKLFKIYSPEESFQIYSSEEEAVESLDSKNPIEQSEL